MLYPKKVKYRKWHTMRSNSKRRTIETRGTSLVFGSYGLKSLSLARIRSSQIESARKVISRFLGKSGKIWIRIFPDMPYTQKAPEVPMGMGKGDPQGYCSVVRPGRIIFELDGVEENDAKEALRKAGAKLPIKSKIVKRF